MGNLYTDLTGKNALVTGGSKGIGAATAVALAENGASVAITYCTSQERAQDLVAKHENIRLMVQADLSATEHIEPMMEKVRKEFGAVDILVNNAGSQIAQVGIESMTREFWDRVMALNLTGAMMAIRYVVAGMKQKGWGRIINISSISARSGGGPGGLAYAASKGALSTLTKGLAKELGPCGITVNAVAPGVILTELHEKFNTPENLENLRKATVLGRLGKPEDCAGAVVFLASDAAAYITGETIAINGGLRMD